MPELWFPSKAIAGCIGLLGFAVAALNGAITGADADSVLVRATIAMLACVLVGRLIAWATRLCIAEHLAEHARAHPIPDSGRIVSRLRQNNQPKASDRANSAG